MLTATINEVMPNQKWHRAPAEAAADNEQRILAAAISILLQGEDLLGALTSEIFTRKNPMVFNASIGGHYRHCLDHFTSLMRSLDKDEVDYDHRDRDVHIETNPEFALNVTREIRKLLEQLNPKMLVRTVTARCEVSYEHCDSPRTHSSYGRELVYGIAHAIHHYALISVMARLMDVKLPAHFGVAPSTVAHQAVTVTK
ncbi:MAG: DinB family protein [Pedosphaera sp.]|nr:DinB family protein [Pedosphaera sp.]